MEQLTYNKIVLHSPMSAEECFAVLYKNLIAAEPDDMFSGVDPEGFTFGGFIYTDNTFAVRALSSRTRRGREFFPIIYGAIEENSAGCEISLRFSLSTKIFLILIVLIFALSIVCCLIIAGYAYSNKAGNNDLIFFALLFFPVVFILMYSEISAEEELAIRFLASIFAAEK